MKTAPDYTTEFIISEVRKLQYLYGLKREVRYELERTTRDFTESVAEHVYGMHICATYFLPIEDPDRSWDWQKIYEMITWHDIDEIEVGDTIGYLKTDADRREEAKAEERVLEKLPEHIQSHIRKLLKEYGARETVEAKFVKAIDKIEPQIHLYHDEGKELVHRHGTYYEDHRRIKEPFIKDFPHIYAFSKLIMDKMLEEGFFADDRPKLFEPRNETK